MNKSLIIIICCFVALLSSSWVHAEVFKWVDENGQIHYSDKQPENQGSEKIELKPHTPDLSQLYNAENNHLVDSKETKKPYKKKQKVTMYSASWCGYCKKARAYFDKNNIMYSEYDIETNTKAQKRYEKLGGTGLPLLVANRKQMQGFSVAKFERWYDAL